MSRRPNTEMECPCCGETATCETVDIGVGEQQCSPFVCWHCGWNEEDGFDGHVIVDEMIECEDRGPYPS